MRKRKWIYRISFIVVIIILAALLLPLEVAVKINTGGRIVPKSDYRIIASLPDAFTLEENHYLSAKGNGKQSFIFDRGDVVGLKLNDIISQNNNVQRNDSIGVIESEQLELMLVQKKGELKQKKALLKSYKSGEKESVIKAARKQLELNKTRAENQRKIFKRTRELYQSNLISKQEFERVKNLLETYELEVEIAKTNFKRVTTGQKPEMIDFVKSEIKTLQNELNRLKTKQKEYHLNSPITGQTFINYNSDTLLTIEDRSVLGVVFPVPLERMNDLKVGQEVKVQSIGLNSKSSGEVIKIEDKIHNINNQQVLVVTALLEDNNMPTGMSVKCQVFCGRESLYQKMIEVFKSVEVN